MCTQAIESACRKTRHEHPSVSLSLALWGVMQVLKEVRSLEGRGRPVELNVSPSLSDHLITAMMMRWCLLYSVCTTDLSAWFDVRARD